MPNLDQATFFAERKEHDLRKVAVPYSSRNGMVTVSDDALAAMRAAPLREDMPLTGAEILPLMTDPEIEKAQAAGLKFLARPVGKEFRNAKRRYFGLEVRP